MVMTMPYAVSLRPIEALAGSRQPRKRNISPMGKPAKGPRTLGLQEQANAHTLTWLACSRKFAEHSLTIQGTRP